MGEVSEVFVDPDKDFEAAESGPPEFYFEERSGFFWLLNPAGDWVALKEGSFKRHLASIGFRKKADPDKGETISPLEAVVEEVEMSRRVFYAGPLAGWGAGVHEMEGRKILVTESPKLVDPLAPPKDAPGLTDDGGNIRCRGWPVLGQVIENLLSSSSDPVDQLAVYYTYVWHTLTSLHNGLWSSAPAMCVAGEVRCGKSLLFVSIHKELFGGRQAKPYEYMIGKDNFNEEIYESVLLTIDDEASDTSIAARRKLGAEMKKMVANDGARLRGMFSKGMTLKPMWRLTVLVNDEPDAVMVLPPVDRDIFDKLILFKAYRKDMPMPSETPLEKAAFFDRLRSELPHFVWWILNEFKPPKELLGRFGVKYFHHPDILAMLHELSPEARLWQFIERVLLSDEDAVPRMMHGIMCDRGEWRGTCEELEHALKSKEGKGELSRDEIREVPKPAWIGRRLSKLNEVFGDAHVKLDRASTRGAKRIWHLRRRD